MTDRKPQNEKERKNKHVGINLDNEKDTIVREIEKQKRKTVMQM